MTDGRLEEEGMSAGLVASTTGREEGSTGKEVELSGGIIVVDSVGRLLLTAIVGGRTEEEEEEEGFMSLSSWPS